jgi:hypothetical protein
VESIPHGIRVNAVGSGVVSSTTNRAFLVCSTARSVMGVLKNASGFFPNGPLRPLATVSKAKESEAALW